MTLLEAPLFADGFALEALAAVGWLAAEALVIIARAARAELEPPPAFESIEERRCGAATFIFLRYPGGTPAKP